MKKVLRVEVTEENGQKYIQVVEQSHRGYGFGVSFLSDEFEEGDFTLASAYYPETFENMYCVRGDYIEHDNDLCYVPDDAWLEKCLAAVKAYNEFESEE